MMILVTACYPIELRWVARRPGVRLVRTAVGERSNDTMTQLGITERDASHLIAVGFCGGVDPRLHHGDLFLAHTIRHRGEELVVDPTLLASARRMLHGYGPTVGVCASTDHVLDAISKHTLAETGVAAVDMESGPLARWGSSHRIPYLLLRVVLDPAETDLPFTTDRPLWASMLRRPLAAAKVGRNAIRCGQTLGTAVNTVVEGLQGEQHA